jgi:hypothetical protein
LNPNGGFGISRTKGTSGKCDFGTTCDARQAISAIQWDRETDTVAVSDGRTWADLDMQDAFDAADKLNAGGAQQQQQPQPKDDKKE